MILNACDLILLLDWEEENSIAINDVILVFVLITLLRASAGGGVIWSI